jgi:hypothetical protein
MMIATPILTMEEKTMDNDTAKAVARNFPFITLSLKTGWERTSLSVPFSHSPEIASQPKAKPIIGAK